jgi:hypothetical protein
MEPGHDRGMGMVEACKLAEQVVEGKPATIRTDGHDAAFDLTDKLMSFARVVWLPFSRLFLRGSA